MIIRAVDLETTGFDAASHEVIEIGFYDIVDGKFLPDGKQSFVRPARPIPPVSSGIHHITDADVVDAKPWVDAWRALVETRDDGEELKFVAHMASFERQWLDPLIKADWICTYKCSLRQWPDLESHGLQSLRYELVLPAKRDRSDPPHRATPDAYLCGLLLMELLKHQSIETLIKWSNEPTVFTKFNFGKFDGKPLSAADFSYLEFLAFKADQISDDWRWNAKQEMERRAAASERAVVDARKAYLDHAVSSLPRAATVGDLEAWYTAENSARVKHGFLPGTDEYDVLINACSARKAELIAAGQPKFDPAMSP